MPNWCANNLTANGPEEDRKRFFADVASHSGRIADMVMPIPADLKGHHAPERDEARAREMFAKHGATDWYDWCVENWGTKWDADRWSANIWEDEDPDTFASYQTAWCPFGNELMLELSRKYPTLEFTVTYDESANGFCGMIRVRNGELLDDNYAELNENGQWTERASGKVLATAKGLEDDEDGTDAYMESLAKVMERWEGGK